MAVAPTYPGVYIEEVPSGVHTITGVATSITAFVGFTQSAPVDKAVHIFSFGDYERGFGPVTLESPVSRGAGLLPERRHGGLHRPGRAGRRAASVSVKTVDHRRQQRCSRSRPPAKALGQQPAGRHRLRHAQSGTACSTSRSPSWSSRTARWSSGRTEMFRNLSMDSLHPAYVAHGRQRDCPNLVSATRARAWASEAWTEHQRRPGVPGRLPDSHAGGLPGRLHAQRAGPVRDQVRDAEPHRDRRRC